MQKEHLAFAHHGRIVFIKHGEIDPNWVVNCPHRIAAGIQAGMAQTGFVKDLCMCGENLAHGPAGLDGGLAGLKRIAGNAVHTALGGVGFADDQSLHHGGVIAGVGARPFKRQLVLRIKMAAAGGVAAQQCAFSGANDEFISGIIAAATKDRALHFGQNIAFKGTGAGAGQCCIQRIIREGGGAAVHVQLRRRFILPQVRNQPIGPLQVLVKSVDDGLPIGEGKTWGFGFQSNLAAIAQGFDQIRQSACR